MSRLLMLLSNDEWIAPTVWAILYISDYALTIVCARLYRAQDNIVFEGSYEITPMFQADVNALRLISGRFIALLIGSTAYLAFVGWLTRSAQDRGAYWLAIGAMVLTELTVHIRHFRNLFLFRRAQIAGNLQGRIEYSRGLLLRASALELMLFSSLYAVLFLLTASPFILGGALGCGGLSVNHYRLARRHDSRALKAA